LEKVAADPIDFRYILLSIELSLKKVAADPIDFRYVRQISHVGPVGRFPANPANENSIQRHHNIADSDGKHIR